METVTTMLKGFPVQTTCCPQVTTYLHPQNMTRASRRMERRSWCLNRTGWVSVSAVKDIKIYIWIKMWNSVSQDSTSNRLNITNCFNWSLCCTINIPMIVLLLFCRSTRLRSITPKPQRKWTWRDLRTTCGLCSLRAQKNRKRCITLSLSTAGICGVNSSSQLVFKSCP